MASSQQPAAARPPDDYTLMVIKCLSQQDGQRRRLVDSGHSDSGHSKTVELVFSAAGTEIQRCDS
eukprot:SAG31_NODE_23_length_33717_cov_17.863585_23_plen_65_part_00